MQAPAPPPSQPKTPPTDQASQDAMSALGLFGSIMGLLSLLFVILFSYGAAKLSYDKFGSIGWAIVNFFFATFYYPYYAIFLSGPQAAVVGGRPRRR